MKLKPMLFSLLVACAAPLPAQVHFEQSESRVQNSPIAYEAVALFGADSSKLLLNIHYRIGQSFFIYVLNESVAPKTEYVAHGELVVELLNDQKVSVDRQIRQLPLSRTSLPKESDRTQSLQGVVSFSVRPGTYTIVFSVDDHESGRTFMEKTRKVTILEPKSNAFGLSHLFFVQQSNLNEQTKMFVPMNRGGAVLLGGAGGLLTEIVRPTGTDTLTVHWKLEGQADGFGEETKKREGSQFTQFDGLLQLTPQDQGVLYNLRPQSGPWKTLFIPIPLERLEPGSYVIELQYRLGTQTKQQREEFRVSWPSRPFSLMDPELAIDALRHVASEAEIEAMQSGSSEHRSQAFHQFWKARNNDTTTAYNEAMAEYYYRVDETMRKFSTARENDGYKTDRGRIYILYGPPPKSERLLRPDTPPTEIWTYDRIHRRFIFIDPTKNGNYILSQAENL